MCRHGTNMPISLNEKIRNAVLISLLTDIAVYVVSTPNSWVQTVYYKIGNIYTIILPIFDHFLDE